MQGCVSYLHQRDPGGPMRQARTRVFPLILPLALSAVMTVATALPGAAEKVSYVPVQAGPVAAGRQPATRLIDPVEPYATGRVLVKLSDNAVKNSAIPHNVQRLQSLGPHIGIPAVDQVLAAIGATNI